MRTLHGGQPGTNPSPRHERKGDWILTYSGRAYWPFDPRPEEVRLVDIAHGLACENRYVGHTRRPYSVGQHSVLVCRRVMQLYPGNLSLARESVLHDATEAYLKDLPRPIKIHIRGYSGMEDQNALAIGTHFGLGDRLVKLDPRVKSADVQVMWTEKRDLRPPEPYTDHAAPPQVEPLPDRIEFWGWEESKAEFLYLCHSLGLK